MAQVVFRDYDRAALDREYDNRAKVKDAPEWLERYARESAKARAEISGRLDVAYGPSPGEALDVFPAPGSAPAPVHVFIHGGYWHRLDKADFSYVARGLMPAGAPPQPHLSPSIARGAAAAPGRRARGARVPPAEPRARPGLVEPRPPLRGGGDSGPPSLLHHRRARGAGERPQPAARTADGARLKRASRNRSASSSFRVLRSSSPRATRARRRQRRRSAAAARMTVSTSAGRAKSRRWIRSESASSRPISRRHRAS